MTIKLDGRKKLHKALKKRGFKFVKIELSAVECDGKHASLNELFECEDCKPLFEEV